MVLGRQKIDETGWAVMKSSVIKKREDAYAQALRQFRDNAGMELARQAQAASAFTGLSVGFCVKLVLHRMQGRMGV